jgi:hypothetical protein
MKKSIIAVAAAMLVTTGANAGSHNPAMKDPTAVTTHDAAKGRNSFTQSQAQGRITKAGYSNVSKLMKNENGVWQGTAMKDGAKVNVALDYKGNVTTH